MSAAGRLNSSIGPRAKQYLGAHIYTTTPRNKTVKGDKIKHIFAMLYIYYIVVEEKSSKNRKFNGPEYLTATFGLI